MNVGEQESNDLERSNEDADQNEPEEETAPTHRYNMRQAKRDLKWQFGDEYSFVQNVLDVGSCPDLVCRKLKGYIMVLAQMPIKKGIKMFGERAVLALLK